MVLSFSTAVQKKILCSGLSPTRVYKVSVFFSFAGLGRFIGFRIVLFATLAWERVSSSAVEPPATRDATPDECEGRCTRRRSHTWCPRRTPPHQTSYTSTKSVALLQTVVLRF